MLHFSEFGNLNSTKILPSRRFKRKVTTKKRKKCETHELFRVMNIGTTEKVIYVGNSLLSSTEKFLIYAFFYLSTEATNIICGVKLCITLSVFTVDL